MHKHSDAHRMQHEFTCRLENRDAINKVWHYFTKKRRQTKTQ